MRRRRTARTRAWWGLVALLALFYLAWHLMALVNAFVWLPTMPDLWYGLGSFLNAPLGLYFDGAFALLGGLRWPYWAYALATRAPLLLVSGACLRLGLRRVLG